jgi:hypothetical protein
VCVFICVCAQNTHSSTEPKEVRDTTAHRLFRDKSQVTICCRFTLLVSHRMPNQVGGKPTLLGCHTHEELDRVFRALAELISADETSSEESSESSSIPDLVDSDDEDDDALSLVQWPNYKSTRLLRPPHLPKFAPRRYVRDLESVFGTSYSYLVKQLLVVVVW